MASDFSSKNFSEFIMVANEYCHLVENVRKYESTVVVEILRKILPMLYLKGSILKPIENIDESYAQRFVTEENYEILLNELHLQLKAIDKVLLYDEVKNQAIEYSLSEWLCDIYQDLKDVLLLLGRPLNEEKLAANNMAVSWFEERWGNEVVLAMPILHRATFPVSI